MTWTPYSAQPIRNRETVRFRPAAGHGRNGAPYTVDGRFTKEERLSHPAGCGGRGQDGIVRLLGVVQGRMHETLP